MIITPEVGKQFGDYQVANMLQLEGETQELYFLDGPTLAVHQKLFEIVCPICKNHFSTVAGLQSHVKKKHGVSYWCVFGFQLRSSWRC